jgi:hypothetical protein
MRIARKNLDVARYAHFQIGDLAKEPNKNEQPKI